MDRTAPSKRGRIVAAVAVSVGLHTLIGLAFWHGPARGGPTATRMGTAVAAPDEGETIFVLRDPPSPRPKLPAPKPPGPADTRPPATLPPSVAGTHSVKPDAGAPIQSGHSQTDTGSWPKNAGSRPLHGNLKGKSIVYVLDRSSSMGSGGLLSTAKEAVKGSLAALDPDVRFGIVAYNGAAEAFGRELVPATPEAVRRAAAWLDGRSAEGRSNHRAGFEDGLWLRPDVVFLLTDADDLDEPEVRVIAGLIRRQVRLNVAIFGHRRSDRVTPLGRLVRELGGTVQFVGPN